MNKKYFFHFTWIITLIMTIFTILCAIDGTSLMLPLFTYGMAMIIYVLPMSYIGGKAAEIICMEFPNNKAMEDNIKNLIIDKTKRKLIVDKDRKKCFQKQNRYSKWLTNEVVMEMNSSQIYLYIPKAYQKYFKEII